MINSPTGQVNQLRNHTTSTGFTGSVMVAMDGQVIWHEGFGWTDQLHTKPVTTHTPFWVASISKNFTAAAILTLAEQGKLSVKDTITKFIGYVPEDKQEISIHQLLTHTAGLRQNYAADGIVDRADACRAILAEPLKESPGQGFAYSNDAYNLLAALIEIASGESFETYLQRHLFEPAGLLHTGFWGYPGHETVAEIHGEVALQDRQPHWGFRGAVGISSSTADLHQWYQALQGDQVLSQDSRRKLMTPHVSLGTTEHAGYGWFLTLTPSGTTSIWTRGTEGFGHNAIMMTYPEEKVVIIAASNAGEREGVAVTRQLADELARIISAAPAGE